MLGALGMSLAVLVTSSVAGYAAESVSLKDKNFEYSIDKNTEGTNGIFITKYIEMCIRDRAKTVRHR